MSRAKEIEEKRALQTKLQVVFNSSRSKVLSWLEEYDDDKSMDSSAINKSREQFFNLPVVQTGSGISFEQIGETDTNDIHTIGEFMESDKSVKSLSKKKRTNGEIQQRNSIYRIQKNDSTAMVSLKNKLRNGNRQKIRRDLPKQDDRKLKLTVRNKGLAAPEKNDASSSEDEDPCIQKHVKKQFGLMFTGKKGKK